MNLYMKSDWSLGDSNKPKNYEKFSNNSALK